MGRHETELTTALLDITPKLVKRLRPDMPSDEESGAEPAWREVVALRATPGQLTLLYTLVERERCTMQELAEELAVAPSTATAMVKRLVAQGYIERSRDDADWRTVWVKPTEAGKLAVEVYQQARLRSLQCRLKYLSDEERASIQVALPALYHLIEGKKLEGSR
ncbi:MAG TPA: MarR family transcriptional regulator [Ktedonobacteraceae bacterium]|nr:MarR family transcriptional regulator [Ktedonobacteraceae bacterium]